MLRREFLIGLGASAAVVACGPKIPVPSVSKEKPKPKETSGFEPGTKWRLNWGPHDDPEVPENQRVLHAIDIGTPDIVNIDGQTKSGLTYNFSVLKAGKIYSVDRDSGIISIRDDEGLIWKYEHLDLDPKFDKDSVNKKVSLYDNLGIVSFKSSPGGYSTGLHVHLGIFREINGKLVKQEIDGLRIGIWTFYKGNKEGEGFAINDKGEKRQADLRRCLPTKGDPQPCGRNEKGEIINNSIETPYK